MYLQVGKLYLFSHFYVRPAPASKTCGDSIFELELRFDSTVEYIEDIDDFPQLEKENFTEIGKLKILQEDQTASKYHCLIFMYRKIWNYDLKYFFFIWMIIIKDLFINLTKN